MVPCGKILLPVILLASAISGLIAWRQSAAASGGPTGPAISPAGTGVHSLAARIVALPFHAPEESLADEITRTLRQGPATDRDRGIGQLLPRLVAADPAAAGHLALAWEPGAAHDELLRQVIRLWAEHDLSGAITWLTSLLDVSDRALAAGAAITQVAQTDRAGALDLAQALKVGLDDGSLEHMAQVWTEEEPLAAVSWVTTQPAGLMRDRLVARIAWVRAQQEPAEAANLLLQHLPPGDTRDSALLAVVRQWARRDPTGLAASPLAIMAPAAGS